MSTIRISQLTELHNLGANTSATEFLAIDSANLITGRITATTISTYLYANNALNVGNNAIVLPNAIAQFAGTSNNYVQVNLENNSSNGSADYIITADNGTDSANYLDLGLNGSTYNYPGYTSAGVLDGYLMVQGNGTSPGGNLVIGTFTENRDLVVSLGSTNSDGHFARFKYNTGLQLLRKPIIFADGSSQNTAAATLAYSQSSFAKANTVDTANTFLQANDATTLAAAKLYADANGGSALAAAKVYTDSANTWLRANDATTLASAKSYADGLNAAQLATAFAYTDSAYAKANAATNSANAGYSQANTTATNLIITNSLASGAYTLADAANTVASGAYNKANNALANTSGTFNGNLTITGRVEPQKGFVYTPTVFAGSQTAITIDHTNDSVVRAQTATGLTVTLSNLLAGKEVVAWITNTSGFNQTLTHGISAINSTVNATTYAIPSTSTVLVRYMSIDGNLQNTFVSITHA
jgi:hypothetical protein